MSAHPPFQPFKLTTALGVALLALTACGGGDDTPAAATSAPTVQAFKTLGLVQPVVVGQDRKSVV